MVGVAADVEVAGDLLDCEISFQSAAVFIFEAISGDFYLFVLGGFI